MTNKRETAQFSTMELIAQRKKEIATSVKTEKPAKASKPKKEIDPNSIAPSWMTYKLFLANCSAHKVNGCPVHNDWKEQGLTVAECQELIAEYNAISGYVSKPKGQRTAKVAKQVATVPAGIDIQALAIAVARALELQGK